MATRYKNPARTGDRLLTAEECRRVLGWRNTMSVYHAASAGRLPSIKVGYPPALRFIEREIRDLMKPIRRKKA